jgi:photosystem II stability/assembly factor-like uncharacterized protein
VTPDEQELRPAPSSLMPAIGLATAIILTLASVGVLVATRHLGRQSGTAASGARVASPSRTSNPTPTTTAPASSTTTYLIAPTANVVWALVDYNHLYRSSDGGRHWEQRAAFAGPFRSASFIDDHEGWILDSGTDATDCPEGTFGIAHTTDAGATWQDLPANGIAQSQCMTGIWFFDARRGFVSGYDRNRQPALYRTSDGGNTFAPTALPDPPFFNPQSGVASSARLSALTLRVEWMKEFGGTLYLEAFGSQNDPNLPPDNQFVLKSTDGGDSWSLVTKVPSRAVVMVTESRWLDYTAPGQAMESVNGGQQFHPYASDFNLAAAQLAFADANVGYAVGPGVIQQTTDGGTQWIGLATPGTAPPTPSPSPSFSGAKLIAPLANVVWALVDGRQLYRSTDQGNTWVRRSTPRAPVGNRPPLISFLDARNGWELVPTSDVGQCVQEAVELWQTTDGAATWHLVSQTHPDVPVDQCKDAMYFKDSAHGALVIGDPTTDLPAMFRTDDGGVTWHFEGLIHGFRRAVSITAVGGTELMEMDSARSPRVYIFLNDVFVNGSVATAPDQAVSNVAFLTPTHWLIEQPGLETTDAGASWHPFNTDYSDAAGVPSQFVFADDHVGYGTAHGKVYRTTDGGAHWELIKTSWP